MNMKTFKTTLTTIALILLISISCYGHYVQLTQYPERMVVMAY